MKKWIFFFLSIQLQAQNFPIKETNGILFTQQRYGANLMNGWSVFQKQDGSVIISTYFNHTYCLKNAEIISLDHYFNTDEKVQNYFEIDGIEIFCMDKCIVIVKNGRVLKRIKSKYANDFSWNYILDLKDKSIYYLTENKILNTNTFYKYDITSGKNIFLFKCKNSTYYLTLSANGTCYFIKNKPFQIYQLKNKSLVKVASYPELEYNNSLLLVDVKNFDLLDIKTKELYIYRDGKRVNTISIQHFTNIHLGILDESYLSYTNNGTQAIYQYDDFRLKRIAETTQTDKIIRLIFNKFSNSFYTCTSTDFAQLFLHINKYPRLFFNTNSNSVFTLQQDNKGTIYAGSYNSGLVTVDSNKVTENNIALTSFLNGGLTYQNHVLLFGEAESGAVAFENPDKYWKVADSVSCFYSYLAKDNTLYLGTSEKGLYYCKNAELEYGKKLKWEKVSIAEGLRLNNILTITEDKFGNIWTGRGSQGIGVYNPKTHKAITWLIEEGKIDFGSTASLKDDKNTLWFGTNTGELVYYKGKHSTDYDVKNFESIKHPLLEKGEKISFIHQWKEYLILGGGDKIVFFNLKKWYENKTVLVRYLNAYETHFTSPTEQNTILTDINDESIWFATTDMVYQWDIKTWLKLPTFNVIPTITITNDSLKKEFSSRQTINFKPTKNSFGIDVNYQTKDNLPRFINGNLVKKGEDPAFETPNLQTKFNYTNLSSGDYIFYVRVCQQDGRYDIFEYPIYIDTFIWQKWWFWLLICIPICGVIIFFFQKRSELEKQKKKLSQLNLSSLSNQFRPHFMLNALNSIGSQLRDKPHAEKVISRLGESIDILYGFIQKNNFTLSFSNEMKLVENSIEIQKLLFIPELVISISNKDIIPDNYRIPVGILQIPTENALLHGLRHKTDGNCKLSIEFAQDHIFYFISIFDNGVGRDKSAKINKFKNNGNGLKTVSEMIKIINRNQKNAIRLEIIDKINPFGTEVKIALNKHINYDKIKI